MAGPLADKWRAKYPGEYDGYSDEELEAAIVKKHPSFSKYVTPADAAKPTDDAAPAPKEQAAAAPGPSMGERARGVLDAVKSAGQSVRGAVDRSGIDQYALDTLKNVPRSLGRQLRGNFPPLMLADSIDDAVAKYQQHQAGIPEPSISEKLGAMGGAIKQRVMHPIDTFREDPVGMAMDLAGLKGAGRNLLKAVARTTAPAMRTAATELATGGDWASGFDKALRGGARVAGGAAVAGAATPLVGPSLGALAGLKGQAVAARAVNPRAVRLPLAGKLDKLGIQLGKAGKSKRGQRGSNNALFHAALARQLMGDPSVAEPDDEE